MKLQILSTGLRGLLLTSLFAAVSASAGSLADQLDGKLVKFEDGKIVPAGAEALAGKKYIAVYYSAHWCGPCRKFTPELVKFYKAAKEAHPELEIIFVSSDRDAESMKQYMDEDGMPWLAMDFDERKNPVLREHAASGIPYMVVLDPEGKVLIEKPEGEDWLYPGKVVEKLKRMMEG